MAAAVAAEERLEFGLEAKVGVDRKATRKAKSKESEESDQRVPVDDPPIGIAPGGVGAGELSWRKVRNFRNYEWGGLLLSFVKPVERYLRITLIAIVNHNAW